MTTETKSVAQQLVDILVPSNEALRNEAVIRIEAALEAVKRAEREECAKVAESFDQKTEPYEHWESGNYDDSYQHGVEMGNDYAAQDIAESIRKRGGPSL